MAVVTNRDHLSYSEALERLNRPAPGRCASTENNSSTSWDLNTDFDHARTLANRGWMDKAAELEGYMTSVNDLDYGGFQTSLDVTGECVDVGAYLAGEPECMMSMAVPAKRSITFVVNVSFSAACDARQLLNRGIAVAAAVYALQCNGVSVSLKVGSWVDDHNGHVHETFIEINQYGEYISPARLAFWLAHPASLRRCIFRINEHEADDVRHRFGFYSGQGYGYPCDPPEGKIPTEGDSVFIPFPQIGDVARYDTPDVAFEEIRKILADQGIELRQRNSYR
jgi:hypothetical protein